MTKTRCAELGVCQCLNADQCCPGCTAWQHDVLGAELPRPTYPFAPGVIEGPGDLPVVFMDDDGPWLPLSCKELARILTVLVLVSAIAGYLVERFA